MSVDIVVDANYGDSGKGITTARIAKKYNDSKNTIVVLNNGGAQRGHSVNLNGFEHIFKHYGSATPLNVESYFGPKFILNPMQFVKEYDETLNMYGIHPISSRSPECIWSTPWDMMANQIHQKEKWTGSCGMGIWETIKRYAHTLAISFDEFCVASESSQTSYLKTIRDYYFGQIEKIAVPDEYRDSWFSDGTIKHFIEDCRIMFLRCPVREDLDDKKHVIIENGQGMLLCDEGKDDVEKTPSETGVSTIFGIDKNLMGENPIVHFVTRPYLTRHGSANWENNKKPHDFVDTSVEINQYNEFQHELCYAYLNIEDLKNRCDAEVAKVGLKNYVVEVTHCDEMDAEKDFKRFFKNDINFYDRRYL
jgi:adenylosuccinate synthase